MLKQLLIGNNGQLLILTLNNTDLSLTFTTECFCDREEVRFKFFSQN